MLHKKRHLNVVLIGHADSGKSTIRKQILGLTNQVDHEKNLDSEKSWYLPNIVDPNISEMQDVAQVGRSFFETESNRFTILDAPAHKSFAGYMISGVIQADICVLVISARRGEIDRAFYEDFWLHFPASGKIISEEQKEKFTNEILGQTREHVEVVKNMGVSKLIVLVNKMDDPTVNWSEMRYNQIKQKMVKFLELTGYNTEKDVVFLPMSGLHGINIDKRMHTNVCNWWGDRPCFFEALDSIEVPQQDANGPFRMLITDTCEPINERTVIMGKVESGCIRVGDDLVIMPIKEHVKVCAIYSNRGEVMQAGPLEALRVCITGVEGMNICSGFVLSSTVNAIPVVYQFIAEIKMDKHLKLLPMIIAGFEAKICIHGVRGNCEIYEIRSHIDLKTRKHIKSKRSLRSGDIAVCCIRLNTPTCAEKFVDSPLFGRFLLQEDDGKPMATGEVIDL